MKNLEIKHVFLLFLLVFFAPASYAWDHSIDIGYGYSHDPRHAKYHYSGFLLTGDLFPLYSTPKTRWSLNGALGQWHATTPHNKHLTTAALSFALRYYPFYRENNYPSYLLGSVGPAYLSNRTFGKNTQAKNLSFQFNLGLGKEFAPFDVNFRAVHYSNAYLRRPDEGFTILYMLSIGYLF